MATRLACSDSESFEGGCSRRDVVNEYEQKSAGLLQYISNMEAAFEQDRAEFEQRQCCLKEQNKKLQKQLERRNQCRYESDTERRICEAERDVQEVRDDCKKSERALVKEQRRVEELQAAIQELQQELQRRAEAACCQKRRDKERREKMEKENEILRQKSTLGWMLGCLYELYLRLDPSPETGSTIKLVGKLQRDLEYESFHEPGDSAEIDYDRIENEIRRLVSRAQESLKSAATGGAGKDGGCPLRDPLKYESPKCSLGSNSGRRARTCRPRPCRLSKGISDLSQRFDKLAFERKELEKCCSKRRRPCCLDSS